MDRNELYLARLMLRDKIYSSTGFAFQDLFSLIKEQQPGGDFIKIKPQGKLGDQKNDGYEPSSGTYYQVYAPEELEDIRASGKLKKDYEGVVKHWDKRKPIKHFRYVVNDRYLGSYPTVEAQLAALRTQFAPVTFELIRAKHIEDSVLALPGERIEIIVGPLGGISSFGNLDVSTLDQVIKHLLAVPAPEIDGTIPEDPDFEKKLKFNGLSRVVALRLRAASIHTQIVEDYFSVNSVFLKEDLKTRFSGLYREANELLPPGDGRADAIYLHILRRGSPRQSIPVQAAVEVLMAHYFEHCDIFETPEE